jgi:hypothetical protein
MNAHLERHERTVYDLFGEETLTARYDGRRYAATT